MSENSAPERADFSNSLRRARRVRRLSQLELALRLGVSQRHISFVEGGRSRPSKPLLRQWLAELDMPLVHRNQVLIAAGFAPEFAEQSLDEQELRPALNALRALLDAPNAAAAMVLDSRWNLLMINDTLRRVGALLMPQLADLFATAQPSPSAPLSMLDIMLHDAGLFAHMSNIGEIAPSVLAHLRESVLQHPELKPMVDRIAAKLQPRLRSDRHNAAPLLCSHFETARGTLKFFSVFSTFGTPQHITLASLRVEHLFPADWATQRVLEELASANYGEKLPS